MAQDADAENVPEPFQSAFLLMRASQQFGSGRRTTAPWGPVGRRRRGNYPSACLDEVIFIMAVRSRGGLKPAKLLCFFQRQLPEPSAEFAKRLVVRLVQVVRRILVSVLV